MHTDFLPSIYQIVDFEKNMTTSAASLTSRKHKLYSYPILYSNSILKFMNDFSQKILTK